MFELTKSLTRFLSNIPMTTWHELSAAVESDVKKLYSVEIGPGHNRRWVRKKSLKNGPHTVCVYDPNRSSEWYVPKIYYICDKNPIFFGSDSNSTWWWKEFVTAPRISVMDEARACLFKFYNTQESAKIQQFQKWVSSFSKLPLPWILVVRFMGANSAFQILSNRNVYLGIMTFVFEICDFALSWQFRG